MELIKQRSYNDCAIASLAMYFKKSYEEIYQKASEMLVEDGLFDYQMELLSIQLNSHLKKKTSNWMPSKAIIVVPIKTEDNSQKHHAMYTDGKEIYDPGPNDPGIKPIDVLKEYDYVLVYAEDGEESHLNGTHVITYKYEKNARRNKYEKIVVYFKKLLKLT